MKNLQKEIPKTEYFLQIAKCSLLCCENIFRLSIPNENSHDSCDNLQNSFRWLTIDNSDMMSSAYSMASEVRSSKNIKIDRVCLSSEGQLYDDTDDTTTQKISFIGKKKRFTKFIGMTKKSLSFKNKLFNLKNSNKKLNACPPSSKPQRNISSLQSMHCITEMIAPQGIHDLGYRSNWEKKEEILSYYENGLLFEYQRKQKNALECYFKSLRTLKYKNKGHKNKIKLDSTLIYLMSLHLYSLKSFYDNASNQEIEELKSLELSSDLYEYMLKVCLSEQKSQNVLNDYKSCGYKSDYISTDENETETNNAAYKNEKIVKNRIKSESIAIGKLKTDIKELTPQDSGYYDNILERRVSETFSKSPKSSQRYKCTHNESFSNELYSRIKILNTFKSKTKQDSIVYDAYELLPHVYKVGIIKSAIRRKINFDFKNCRNHIMVKHNNMDINVNIKGFENIDVKNLHKINNRPSNQWKNKCIIFFSIRQKTSKKRTRLLSEKCKKGKSTSTTDLESQTSEINSTEKKIKLSEEENVESDIDNDSDFNANETGLNIKGTSKYVTYDEKNSSDSENCIENLKVAVKSKKMRTFKDRVMLKFTQDITIVEYNQINDYFIKNAYYHKFYVPDNFTDTRPDGNCFFRCLSYWITGVQTHHEKIRQKYCDYRDLSEKHAMRQTHGVTQSWATDMDILAIAKMLHVNIHVYVNKDYMKQWVVFSPYSIDEFNQGSENTANSDIPTVQSIYGKNAHHMPIQNIFIAHQNENHYCIVPNVPKLSQSQINKYTHKYGGKLIDEIKEHC
ncbi:hypothetical protein A3Q56_01762 [Intoshia linei]|uniref:OTU domain-containing protein n=1 Tax=Intoshia linei TaxID=1819745 RepID=A0A177BA10_9BILA|nr:hypothetical protein A3Q56_01762 [Intoshia linei]